ncbi:CoA pyrophosphatase [Roseateles sp. BYS180W]|uniref:CoA pyrophosphatase n=1 Tax=Roseateles rivi TaxID=3299028 RepID=A0ABW7FZH4_9BURK
MAIRAPAITNPTAATVLAVDRHLPALEAHRLAPAFLRQRLAVAATMPVSHRGDAADLPQPTLTAAAVLIALVQRSQGLTVLLTRRAQGLRSHGGQISFPGGRQDATDASAIHTALREAQEEVGLDPSVGEVLGCLPSYRTVTDYEVTPVLALVAQPPAIWQTQPSEVQEAFEVPLAYLMNPAHHEQRAITVQGWERRFLAMPWVDTDVESRPEDGNAGRYFIWGATAAMLRNLYEVLSQ